jgi:hypothetical protein
LASSLEIPTPININNLSKDILFSNSNNHEGHLRLTVSDNQISTSAPTDSSLSLIAEEKLNAEYFRNLKSICFNWGTSKITGMNGPFYLILNQRRQKKKKTKSFTINIKTSKH